MAEDWLFGVIERDDANAIEVLYTEAEAGNVDVNAFNLYGWTPLLLAADRSNLVWAAALLSVGADVNVRDSSGATPLHYAASNGDADMVRLLLDYGADIGARDRNQITPLSRAAENGDPETIRLLLEAGADVNARDADGNTPLHTAADYDDVEAVEVLLRYNADPFARNRRGETPLEVARGRSSEAADYLAVQAAAARRASMVLRRAGVEALYRPGGREAELARQRFEAGRGSYANK